MDKDLGILGSSTDSTKRSNTVNGVVLLVSGLVVGFIRHKFNVDINAGDVNSFLTGAIELSAQTWIAYGVLWKTLTGFRNKIKAAKTDTTL